MEECKKCINYVKDKCSICQKAENCAHFMSYEMMFKSCYRECNGCEYKAICDLECGKE